MDTPNTRAPTKSVLKCFPHHRKYLMLSDRELDFQRGYAFSLYDQCNMDTS